MKKRSESVVRWRQRAKAKMIAGFGDACGICGYNKAPAALEVHHLDPTQKDFTFGAKGVPRAWAKMVAEALKCALLCRNCHAEVHAGVTAVPADIRRFIEADAGAAMPLRRKPIRKRPVEITRPRSEKVPDRPRGKSLRALVQRTSRVAVAKQFGVSEAAVRKWLVIDTRRGLADTYDQKVSAPLT